MSGHGIPHNAKTTKTHTGHDLLVVFVVRIVVGIISYFDNTDGALKIAACNNPTCTTSTNTTIDSNGYVGYFTSIAIGTNGNPIISYYDYVNGALKVFSPWWITGGR